LLVVGLSWSTAANGLPWGVKSRHCALLAGKLATLEADPDAPAGRIRRLREWIDNRCVALNEIQVVGSHNSYHVQPRPTLLAALLGLSPIFAAWEYTHLALDQQFATQNVRQIELDVFADPVGGLFARRGGLQAIGEDPISGIAELTAPGFKVLHVQDLDFETTCYSFVQCLRNVKAWSDTNRTHLPLMILIEAKDEQIPDPLMLGFAIPVPIGAAQLDAIDDEIRSVFPKRQLITPDRVRRGFATLEEAILTLGWPRLGVLRGKVMFALDNGGSVRDAYVAGHPSLEGRVLFTDSPPGTAEAGFVKMNDPLPDPGVIANLVSAGYVVRTRADVDTAQARSGDTTQRDAALASGAQWVSTDYPVPNPAFGTGYTVQLGAPARCNPINAPAHCRSATLE
jgi:hypothetical protein